MNRLPRAKKPRIQSRATHVDGIRFASQKEARYYVALKARQQSGLVRYFLRQVPLHLPGNIRYVVDFVEFHRDGSVHYIDVKGHKTEVYKLKKRQVEALYPIEVEER